MLPNSKRQHSNGLPRYEPHSSIIPKKEYIQSIPIPMITSKNDDEYDYVLVIKDNPNTIHSMDARSTGRNIKNYTREIMRRLDDSKLIVHSVILRVGDIYLIKIRSDDELLEEWAEKMHLLMRLNNSGVYAPFQRTLKDQFEITTFFPDSVFRSRERQLIIHEILHKKQWENGVELNSEILPSIVYMYPLHINNRKNELYCKWNHGLNLNQFDDRITVDNKTKIINNIRIIFHFLWPTQPLNDVIEYFGEEVGFYFAFVEYFIKWLYIPTIAGTLIFFIQLKHFNGKNGNKQCNSLNLKNGKQNNDDNILPFDIQTCESILPYFSLFMCIWTTTFIQFWKRRQISLAQKWGVLNYEEKDHKTRLSYKSHKSDSNNNNDDNDMFSSVKYNLKIRACKVIITTPIIFLLVISCVVFMFWFLYMRESIRKKGNNIHVVLSYCLHTGLWGLIVPLFSGLHIKICQYLNNWENWRTESDHYKYYTAKVCSLLLINTFVAMYYLCCFQQSLPAVAFQVAAFMSSRLFLDIFFSLIILPYIRKYKLKRVIKENKKFEYDRASIHNPYDPATSEIEYTIDDDKISVLSDDYNKNNKQKHIHTHHTTKRKVIDMTGDYASIKNSEPWNQALSPQYDSFKNYCFLILFFGYVSNFSVAFCLAPLVTLIGMLFKLQSDRFHLCNNTQRPLPRRVSGIGIWLTVLDQMCTFAIITNILIIYFTTNLIEKFFYNKLQYIILFEHLLLMCRFFLTLIIPEMPLHVKAEIRIHQLTRLMLRKKLLEKAQSHNKYKKNRNNRNNQNQTHNNNYSRNQSNMSLRNHNTSNIHIEDLGLAMYY